MQFVEGNVTGGDIFTYSDNKEFEINGISNLFNCLMIIF